MSPLADRVLAYLRKSIAERGGKARRPSTIELEMDGPWVPYEDVVAAARELEAAGLVRFEPNELMGWYVLLCEVER